MIEDLSKYHEPLTDLFADGEGETDPLSKEKADFFAENGYLAGLRVLSDHQIVRLRDSLADLMGPEMADDDRFYEYHHNEATDPGHTLFHALGAWRVSPEFHDLLFHPAIVAAARKLLGGPVRFWHDQLFVKPPLDGGVVAWHQDYSYWTRTRPVGHLTCWIGLDDSTVENGCVNYLPGSHRWPLLPRTDLAGNMEAILDILDDEQRASFNPVAIEMPAGHASFHHPLTVHGSFANSSHRPRRAVVLNFFRDGTLSDSDEPLLAGVPPIAKGRKIDGRYFPLVG
jgi:ectoine hydroxylase-related dioxygenase (phytanoyl-CoA dioxygenase family)